MGSEMCIRDRFNVTTSTLGAEIRTSGVLFAIAAVTVSVMIAIVVIMFFISLRVTLIRQEIRAVPLIFPTTGDMIGLYSGTTNRDMA